MKIIVSLWTEISTRRRRERKHNNLTIFRRDFSLRKPRKCFFISCRISCGIRVERNKIRMSRGMRKLRDSSWLVKFHLISTPLRLLQRRIFSHVFWTEREEVSESIIKFIYHENRFASLKADLWTRIGREKSPLIWIHFLTETSLCPRISFEWTIVSA